MGKSQRLSESDLRTVFRLLSDLREMRHDRPAMHQHLIETLLAMLGGTGGFIADVVGWMPGRAPQLMSFNGTKDGIEQVARSLHIMASNNNLFDDPTFHRGVHHQGTVEAMPFHQLVSDEELSRRYGLMSEMKSQLGHKDHLLGWHQKEPGTGNITGLSIHRYGRREKRFNGRETAVVRLFFEELHWLHATGRLTPIVPEVEALPARLKQILSLLLKGRAPKQIAIELDLSVYTVREHISRLYDRVGVNGRDELMAKFMRSKPDVA